MASIVPISQLPHQSSLHHLARAIESSEFPFEFFSSIAEVESWRKEIHRPIYHLHKWWAQRLGSVFRAILLGALSPKDADLPALFYRRNEFPDAVVFDPFMGSGTTIGEATKLGARAIGRDINPVAHFAVRNALAPHRREQVLKTFDAIRTDVAEQLLGYYKTRLPDGEQADVLYYFWVKVVCCPKCDTSVDLFSSYVFARHAYAAKHPMARAVCPECGEISTVRHDADRAKCGGCQASFNPQAGPARGAKATCPSCSEGFGILDVVRRAQRPPAHRLYAKLVLRRDGTKEYYQADDGDRALFEKARRDLSKRSDAYPVVPIAAGYNTNQALNYQYKHWHDMFNERQLLCLSILGKRIADIEDPGMRDLFTCLFSGCLEFNNLFASYKGEGTGAVRHMFSHHILKPERTPIEANLWGTPKSSGAFSTLFESRLLRALDYQADPFEIRVQRGQHGRLGGEKIFGISQPLGQPIAKSFKQFHRGMPVYLSCGDSSDTDIASGSVDAVITDPPFFDNVHYSELADFFFVWQAHFLGGHDGPKSWTTRSPDEVQQRDAGDFAAKLSGVWKECHRVLKPHGLLAFTYHHSRAEGWEALLAAIVEGGFAITQTHPIKAEMSVAAPKQQAQDPIDLDIIIVCRKRELVPPVDALSEKLFEEAEQEAAAQVVRLNRTGRDLSRNDVRIVFMARLLKSLSRGPMLSHSLEFLRNLNVKIETFLDGLHRAQRPTVAPPMKVDEDRQRSLLL